MISLHYVPFQEFQRIKNLKCTPIQRSQIFATYCRINTLYMIKRAGSGHIGSSFSSLDIVSWLFTNELQLNHQKDPKISADIYFSSKGHDVPGLYATLLGLGFIEFDLLHSLRRLDGLPGHPDVSIPFMETNTGPLGMGISKAKGMAAANRLQGKTSQIYVLTGDGELQEGQFWESLPSAVNKRLGELTVIVDHNKIQSDTWVTKVSDLGNIEKKFESFGWHVDRCDGHNLEAFSSALQKFKGITDRPKILIADTIKGKGISFMEHTSMKPEDQLYRFHSGAPDDDIYNRGVKELTELANRQLNNTGAEPLKLETKDQPIRTLPTNPERLVTAYSKALVEQAERNPKLVVLDADLLLDCGLIPFQERFSDRFFECGIAEQDMVSQAGGMALKGLLPVVHSFACFLSTRPNEQIYNNATEKTKVIYVGSLAGLLPSAPGHSHQSVRDISVLSAIPRMILVEPCNEAEVALALDFCLNRTSESCYLRLVSIPCEIPYRLPQKYDLELGKGIPLTEGNDAILFGYGPILLSQAYQASMILADRHRIGLKVINLPWLNRIDEVWLKKIITNYKYIFTLDNHYIFGGQGQLISSLLCDIDASIPVKKFGLTDIPLCGQNDEVLKAHRLDAESLAQNIFQTMKEKVL